MHGVPASRRDVSAKQMPYGLCLCPGGQEPATFRRFPLQTWRLRENIPVPGGGGVGRDLVWGRDLEGRDQDGLRLRPEILAAWTGRGAWVEPACWAGPENPWGCGSGPPQAGRRRCCQVLSLPSRRAQQAGEACGALCGQYAPAAYARAPLPNNWPWPRFPTAGATAPRLLALLLEISPFWIARKPRVLSGPVARGKVRQRRMR